MPRNKPLYHSRTVNDTSCAALFSCLKTLHQPWRWSVACYKDIFHAAAAPNSKNRFTVTICTVQCGCCSRAGTANSSSQAQPEQQPHPGCRFRDISQQIQSSALPMSTPSDAERGPSMAKTNWPNESNEHNTQHTKHTGAQPLSESPAQHTSRNPMKVRGHRTVLAAV